VTVGDSRERARRLVAMVDGIDVIGQPGRRPLTSLARRVAEDSVASLDMLAAERSARLALQARCERLEAIVGKAAYAACVKETS
jgi:hypothetical protein